jgi:copper chaperone CopZ
VDFLHLIQTRGCAFLLAGTLIFSGAASAGGLLEVQQTIYGMDCAPCAHGVERGLEKLEGVKDASVSLNEGYAALTLSPGNSVSLEKIRGIVRDNGFTPKGAEVVAIGTLARSENDQLLLTTGPNQRFALAAASDKGSAWQQLHALPSASMVKIEAQVPEGKTDQLLVQSVEAL